MLHPEHRKALVVSSSTLALLAIICGVYQAIHSSLFLVQTIEVTNGTLPLDEAPVDTQTISNLAGISTGIVNLFDLDLKSVERRILSNPWVRDVTLQKRFPQTLSIAVDYRKPRALMQLEDGILAYVDKDGMTFGQLNLMFQPDLPVLTGLAQEPRFRTETALRILDRWDTLALTRNSPISSLSWDAARGYRALVVYPIAGPSLSRTWIDLGQTFDVTGSVSLDHQLQRLSRVFSYLKRNNIAAHQIWADAGKKIVVKTAHGS